MRLIYFLIFSQGHRHRGAVPPTDNGPELKEKAAKNEEGVTVGPVEE